MKLIVGLGNPGQKYENTRHNIGFMALDVLQDSFNFEHFSNNNKQKADISLGTYKNEKIVLAKPQTFMNLSGESIQLIKSYYKIENKDIIIIHDDKDLPIGTIRIRTQGSSGGHNGIKSIMQSLQTDQFTRIKYGINIDKHEDYDTSSFVLGNFSEDESVLIQEKLKNIPHIIDSFISQGIATTMNKYN